MKIMIIYDTVHAFATQRNANQNYILNNNFKFYIAQFIFFYKRIHAKSGQTPNSCSFFVEKKNQKTTTFFVKKVDKKTTPFRICNSLVKTFSQYSESPSLRVKRSNPNLVKFDFYNLISLINKFYTKWIASLIRQSQRDAGRRRALAPFVRNDYLVCHYERKRSNPICLDCHDFLRSLAMTIKNKFEIISRNENYAFNQNKYFCRNGNNQSLSLRGDSRSNLFSGLLHFVRNDDLICHYEGNAQRQSRTASSNPISLDCHASRCVPNSNARNDGFERDDLFSRNDYGGKFIFGFWDNLNFGFLFNRKIKK